MARKGKEQDSTVSCKTEEEWQEILTSQVLVQIVSSAKKYSPLRYSIFVVPEKLST